MARTLIRYAAASVLVRLADEGARVGLTLLALQRTDNAAVGGLLVGALLVPHVVAAPVVGLLADRTRRPALVVAVAAAAFGAALLVTAVGLGHLPLAAVVVVLLAGGCCGPALTGGLSSQLPAVVAASRLPRAFGLDSLTFNVAGMAGPALVALVAAPTSPALATSLLAGCALLGGGLIAGLPMPVRDTARRRDAGRGDLLGGVRLLLHDRVLAAVTAATSLGQLGIGALPVITVFIATQNRHAAAAGWLLTAVAAGGLLGSLAWTWRPAGPERAEAVVVAGLAGVGLPLAAAAFVSSLPGTIALFALAGFCNGPLFGAVLVIRNSCAPGQLRSQVFTLTAGAKITATAIGAVLAGLIAGHLSGSSLLLLAGACSLVAAGVGQLLLRRSPEVQPAAASEFSRPSRCGVSRS